MFFQLVSLYEVVVTRQDLSPRLRPTAEMIPTIQSQVSWEQIPVIERIDHALENIWKPGDMNYWFGQDGGFEMWSLATLEQRRKWLRFLFRGYAKARYTRPPGVSNSWHGQNGRLVMWSTATPAQQSKWPRSLFMVDAKPRYTRYVGYGEDVQDWLDLIRMAMKEIMSSKEPLQHYFLSNSLFGDFLVTYRCWRPCDVIEAVRNFADMLKDTGADLEQMGAIEQLNLGKGDIPRKISLFSPEFNEYNNFRLTGLSTGPNPDDWQIWLSNPVDGWVGEFWELVEPAKQIMPGAWISDEDEEDDGDDDDDFWP